MKKSVLIPYDRYLYYQKAAKTPIDIPTEDTASSPDIVEERDRTTEKPVSKLSADVIIAHLPKRNKSKAEALIKVVDQHPVLTWNERGELVVDGNPVPYSHISDLLHDALNNTKHEAVGCRLFYKHLENIPQSLINNPNRKKLLRGGGGSNRQLPPIGTPNTEPKPIPDWKLLWKST